MPHDVDGNLVEVGDIVEGMGHYTNYKVSGPVVKVMESNMCNVAIAVPKTTFNGDGMFGLKVGEIMAYLSVEYGNAKDFRLISKKQPAV